jgi:hypothetical protein
VSFLSPDEEELLQLNMQMMHKAISAMTNFDERLILIGVAIKYIFMKGKLNYYFFHKN